MDRNVRPEIPSRLYFGQARKSLWIETFVFMSKLYHGEGVRLVRACGSKLVFFGITTGDSLGQARKSLWIETVLRAFKRNVIGGQARKSLWIETIDIPLLQSSALGQARKSLWIETVGSFKAGY